MTVNIQIFGTKKSSDTRKAERWFKERRIKAQFIDLSDKGISKGELRSVAQACDGLDNLKPSAGPIFPCLFITIACGALSGFHATQSPLMARCMKHEKEGRPIFYGAMITEGVVALI